jgi:tetratricopeptide (TPR) repeat protein
MTRGATISTTYTDNQGHFGFYALPAGAYHVTVQEDGYQPVSERINVNPAFSPTTVVQVTLNPRSESASDPLANRVEGNNPNLIDPKEYTEKFPKEAVKEYEKGLRESNKGRPDSAAEHFQKAIGVAADFYPAHNELGRIYLARSDLPAARREFELTIQLNQSNADAHLNLGNVLLLTRQYESALLSVNEGLRRQPKSAMGQFLLGTIYARLGRTGEAEAALREALILDPEMSKVHLELVNLYLSQQKKSEAVAELQTFLKDFPKDPLAPQAKEVLKRLGNGRQSD